MKFKQLLILINENRKLATYIGNCTDLFESDTGDCELPIFRDVSEFAYKEEEFRKSAEDNAQSFLNITEFKNLADIEHSPISDLNLDSFQFYFYPNEIDGNVYVAYDSEDDIHYFYK